jgi:hypothetical protein
MNITSLRNGALLTALAVILTLPAKSAAESDLVVHPKQVGAMVDFGQIVNGEPLGTQSSDHQPLTRTGVFLTAGGTYNQKLELRMTIGGLFWYPLPENPSPERIVRFGPGVGQAQGIYSFGNPEEPTAQIQFGLFPYKYNPDAVNLGEYLYRSGTYPGSLWSGGWSYLNSASYMAQGAHLSLPMFGGVLKHDFTLFMERDIEPTNDLSPGYMVTYKPAPYFEASAGVVWSHAVSLNSKRLSPKTSQNAYIKSTGTPVQGLSAACTSTNPAVQAFCADQDTAQGRVAWSAWAACDTDNDGKPDANGNCSDIGYYTFRGFKTSARASLDVGQLLNSEAVRAGEFKVYGEIALLGVEDQPFYYENKSERMPMMLGVALPTFGILDQLSLEGEYHKSRFNNTVGLLYDREVPVPLKDASQDNPYAYSDAAVAANEDKFTKDDIKWSVYARRKITEGVTLHAQAASDHLRHFGAEVKPTESPVTRTPSEWYYVLRLDFGLF